MLINKESLEKFKKLYLKNYGIKLNNAEALDVANRVIGLIKAVKA